MSKTKTGIEKKYMSYFQSVETIGILTCAKNFDEAEKKAKDKFESRKSNFFMENCVYDKTSYDLIDTEEWKPEIEVSHTKNGMGWKFEPSEKTKKAIAVKIGKDVDDLTEEDFTEFIKDSVENAVR